jgi:hypothetical protein
LADVGRGARLAQLAAIAVLCAIVFVWYRDCMLNFFFLDDFWVMRDAANLQPWDVLGAFRVGQADFMLYRPLTTVAYAYVLHLLFGYDSSGYHALQLLIFTLNAVLAFAIARRLTGSRLGALAAAVIYALAPGQAVGVYWLAAFTVTGTVFVILLTIWCWLSLEPPRRIWICTLLQIVGVLASEHAATLPVLLLIVTVLSEPRQRWRRFALDLVPILCVVAIYTAAKLAYYLRPDPFDRGYHIGVASDAWLQELGRYATACFNLATLQHPSMDTCRMIGGLLVLLLSVGLIQSLRGARAWRLLALGLAMFVVGLAPVLPLHNHYYAHYVGLPAFGMGLSLVALCQLTTRYWSTAAALIAAAVLIFDVATDGRAWRDNDIFRLMVNGSEFAADWVETAQKVAYADGPTPPVFVPKDAVSTSVFAIGKTYTYFPGLPELVVVSKPARVPLAASDGIMIEKIATLPRLRQLPGWTPRLGFLRWMTSRGRP